MRRKSFTFPVSTLVGSNLANIRAIFRNHKPDLRFYPKVALTLLVAAIFELFNAWERLRWGRKIKTFSMEKDPVFIIGFWRSGTTLLHNLLCQDPEASYTTTLQTVFPNMVLSQRCWLRPLINLMLPALRPFDNVRMDTDFPQEEEYGMVNLQHCSLYNFFQFPGDFDDIVENEVQPETSGRQKTVDWERQYRMMIAKAGLNTGGKRYIGKNPCNLGRIPLLQKMFPGAKFIFIYRNPYRVVESLYRFYLSIIPGVKLQQLPPGFSREKFVRLYVSMMERYEADKSLISPDNLLEIKMEDLLHDKIGGLKKIYAALDLGSFDTARPHLEAYLQENAGYSRESYDIHPDTYTLVNRFAAAYLKKFGYPVTSPPPASS